MKSLTKAKLDAEMLKQLLEREQQQADYIKKLEEANNYKDKVIDELNKKYSNNEE